MDKNNPAQSVKRPRRTLKSALIEPFKQIKLGLYVMIISVLFIVLAGYLFVSTFTQQYQHVMEIFSIADTKTKYELITNDIFKANTYKLIALFVLYIGVLFGVVFQMTHRIYGPLVSIERFVNAIAEGRYDQRVIIRRGDELQRLVGKLNQMADKLQEKHGFPDRRRRSDSPNTDNIVNLQKDDPQKFG